MQCKEECEVFRPIATFSQNIWRYQFPPFSSADELSQVFDSLTKETAPLKEKVKDILMGSTPDPVENVKFIDTLLRLGVSYHFEDDIENQLETIFTSHHNLFSGNHHDLNSTSIVFRVFRQYGFKMSCDVFNKFKDTDGKFKETLIDDVRGMLSLYEAAYLRVHGEDILEEALAFTTVHLKSLENKSNPHLAKQIANALDQPLNKCPPRLAARTYISFYEEEDFRIETLLKFAKLDFNRVQVLHKQEISQIARFWEDSKLSELSYARERYVETYTWSNSVFYEPRYAQGRIFLTKMILLVSILDDTFDAYGTPQELQRLIDALKRSCEISAIDELEDYTKVICKAVLVFFDEIAEEVRKEGRSYSVPYAKDALIRLVNNYQAEVKWSHDGYVPAFEEYMSIATKTSTYDTFITTSFIGMGKMAAIEAFIWLRKEPKSMKALDVIGRLMNDIVSHKFERLRHHCPSSVECYMNQHGLSKKLTLKDFEKILEDAWKDLNEECMRPTDCPRDLLLRILNIARVTYLFYKHEDGYTKPEYVKDDVRALFLDPIPV